jgi:hypothetical protein
MKRKCSLELLQQLRASGCPGDTPTGSGMTGFQTDGPLENRLYQHGGGFGVSCWLKLHILQPTVIPEWYLCYGTKPLYFDWPEPVETGYGLKFFEPGGSRYPLEPKDVLNSYLSSGRELRPRVLEVQLLATTFYEECIRLFRQWRHGAREEFTLELYDISGRVFVVPLRLFVCREYERNVRVKSNRRPLFPKEFYEDEMPEAASGNSDLPTKENGIRKPSSEESRRISRNTRLDA